MTETAIKPATRDIVIDEIFPHAPQMLWTVLTSGDLMGRWLMKPTGFSPEVGKRFTFQTTPAGAWDGTIHCEVLEVRPFERFSFSWAGGDAGNSGYGSKINTIVSWDLSESAGGTRLALRHSGFELPQNDIAYTNLGKGWRICVERVSGIAKEQEATCTAGRT